MSTAPMSNVLAQPTPPAPSSSATSHTTIEERETKPVIESTEDLKVDPMSATASNVPAIKRLKLLDQLLALWIFLAMAVGIILGYFVPNTAVVLESVKFVDVSLPLAISLIVMMWPILCRVSPSALLRLFSSKGIWYHLLFSLVVNWIFAPLLMLGLAWACLPDRQDLREGLILVGLARCIAMVMVWVDISSGDADYCAVLVAFNSVLQIVLYAPFGYLYINVIGNAGTTAAISYTTVAKSVAAFLGIPLALAVLTRAAFIVTKKQKFFQEKFLPFIAPLSLVALLFVTLIIFAAQGENVVRSITDVLRVMAPLLVYFLIMFFGVLYVCKRRKVSYGKTVAQAFTGASNNFELAIAVAVSAYGANSPQALAATVGPLVEVPVLLALAYALVWYRKRSGWDIEIVDGKIIEGETEETRSAPLGDVEKGTGSVGDVEKGTAPIGDVEKGTASTTV